MDGTLGGAAGWIGDRSLAFFAGYYYQSATQPGGPACPRDHLLDVLPGGAPVVREPGGDPRARSVTPPRDGFPDRASVSLSARARPDRRPGADTEPPVITMGIPGRAN
jgi:hypothetical protein